MQKNQINQKNLIERVGIDKSQISGFSLLTIDDDLFEKKKEETKGNMWYIPNEYSCIKLKDGRRIGELKVDTKEIGNLHIKSILNNSTGEPSAIATLNVFTNETGNNLQNMTCDEYRERINQIFATLRSEYGLDFNAELQNLRVNTIEFNTTFWLKYKYCEYGQVLSLMERILPERYATGTQQHRRIKVGVYSSHYVRNFAESTYEEYLKNKEREPLSTKETVYCGNNKSTQVKIYPKLQQLRDTGAVDESEMPKCDAMRIEYTIKDARILASKCNFGSDRVIELTDEKVVKIFKKNFKRDFVDQYNGWKRWNHKELLERVNYHRKNSDKWTANFIRDARKYVQEQNGTPLLFDVEDVRSVLKELESNPQKGNRKFVRFKKNLEYEADLIGNNEKAKEILEKVMNM